MKKIGATSSGAIIVEMSADEFHALSQLQSPTNPAAEKTAKNARRKAVADKAYDVTSIRRKLPNAYDRWFEKDDAELRYLHEQGMSVSDLSKRFGRGQGAIRSRLVKIGLSAAAN